MNAQKTFASAKDFLNSKPHLFIQNWEHFVDFINDFEQTDENLANLETSKIELYATLYLQKLKNAPKNIKSQSNFGLESFLYTKKKDELMEEKVPQFTVLNESNSEFPLIFDIECENKVPLSDFFHKTNLKISVESVKKGKLSNWLAETLVFKVAPLDWTTERTFNDIEKLLNELRRAYPNCLVW